MTAYKRGDVILVKLPYSDLVRKITSNLEHTGETRVPVRKDSPEDLAMGLLSDSVIITDHLATVLPGEIDKVIGRCNCLPEVETALRRVLGL
jgi:hypothetical protein